MSQKRKNLARFVAATILSVGITVPAFAQDNWCPPDPCCPDPCGEAIISDGVTTIPTQPLVAPSDGNSVVAPSPEASATPAPQSFADATQSAPSANNFAQARTGAGSAAFAGGGGGGNLDTPNMIGDLFFTTGSAFTYGFDNPSQGIAAGDRRFKFSDGISPVPTDRVFFNYRSFANAITAGTVGVDVNRFLFGLEKTFLDEQASVEVRVPFASGLNSNQQQGLQGTEFGNMTVATKFLLAQSKESALTTGVALTLPTAGDFTNANGDVARNTSVHLSTYLGYRKIISECLFHQAYAGLDFDLNGTKTPGFALGNVTQDQNLAFLDWQGGAWLHRDRRSNLRSVAALLEFHYTTTLNDADDALDSPFGDHIDLLNITSGLSFGIGKNVSLNVYGALPLRKEEAVNANGAVVSPTFESEVGLQLIMYGGRGCL